MIKSRFGAVALALLVACSSAAANHGKETIEVTPALTNIDQPIHVVIQHLISRKPFSVEMSSTDALGVHWRSHATFRSDAAGTIDLDAMAPRSGDYAGVDGMGLMWTMKPDKEHSAYAWDPKKSSDFSVRVLSNDTTLATTSFQRRTYQGTVTETVETVPVVGFAGKFYANRKILHRPGVVVVGGGGGFEGQLAAALLASHGYPSLVIGYYNLPGVPKTLSKIPIEYFARAIGWLQRQPQVDPKRIIVLGTSRGAEPTLLLAAAAPRIIAGVIAVAGANSNLCAAPGCDGPAWTFRGKALPFTAQISEPSPTDNPAAVIPIERIGGPILLACGTDDKVWNACAYGKAMIGRLEARHIKRKHTLLSYDGAGHNLANLVPYEPADGNLVADEQGRQKLWDEILKFLKGF